MWWILGVALGCNGRNRVEGRREGGMEDRLISKC